MRRSNILVLALTVLVALGVCGAKAHAATVGTGVPGPAYDISADANQRFLADYAIRPGVKKTADGLMYRVLKASDSKFVVQKNSDVVTVYYRGELINGKVFDQTKPEEPAIFQVGNLIPGWTEALKLMKAGDTWELVIPSDLAYGSEGVGGGVVPPDQTLVFVMALAKVEYGP